MEKLDCGHTLTPEKHGIGTGYGVTNDGKRICYACCAERDRESMRDTGKATLYLIIRAQHIGHAEAEVTNWPGSLRFPIGYVRTGRHNMAGKRYDVWFTGPDGAEWHGVTYGDNTQICHCSRNKRAA